MRTRGQVLIIYCAGVRSGYRRFGSGSGVGSYRAVTRREGLLRGCWKCSWPTCRCTSSSVTVEKHASGRIVPSGGEAAGRTRRRAAARAGAFCTATQRHTSFVEPHGQQGVRTADHSAGSRRSAVRRFALRFAARA
jgi:hypothetical protein